jgi:hypothetical protein
MAAYATKYAVYFPKMYSWLMKPNETVCTHDAVVRPIKPADTIMMTRDISKALMFDEVSEVEAMLAKLELQEAVIQKYKATLVIADNFYWTAPRA